MPVKFFKSAAAFRRWLEANHTGVRELFVGFFKKDSGKGGITYPEALDQALCFGWIDGVRKSVDAMSYKIRFTPRRPGSHWSRVNIRHVERLRKTDRMTPAGLTAYAARAAARAGVYVSERRTCALATADEKRFKADPPAWGFFQRQPSGYRWIATGWVVSAKRAETRDRRLTQLIEDSRKRRRLALLAPKQ